MLFQTDVAAAIGMGGLLASLLIVLTARMYGFGSAMLGGVLGLIGGGCIGIFGMPSRDMPQGNPEITMLGLLLLAVGAVLAVYGFTKGIRKNTQRTAAANRIRQNNAASYYQGTLSVNQRTADLSKVIRLERHERVTVSHQPEQYIYTSATVGGITTGGFTKVGGYDYISSVGKTDKFLLKFNNEIISRIQLTPELFEQAKDSPIKYYLKHDKKQILVNAPSTANSIEQEAALRMAQSGNYNMLLRQAETGYPNLEKCTQILQWLCNN